jgi:methylmalonyl-CoA mutase cobalamin-binding domain/chain
MVGGGIIPAEDAETLRNDGFARLFGPGTNTDEIAEWIAIEMKQRFEEEGDDQ